MPLVKHGEGFHHFCMHTKEPQMRLFHYSCVKEMIKSKYQIICTAGSIPLSNIIDTQNYVYLFVAYVCSDLRTLEEGEGGTTAFVTGF